MRADPVTGDAIWRTRLGGRGAATAIAVGPAAVVDGRLWLETSDTDRPGDRLVAIDPRTGRVVSSVHIGDFGAVGLARVGPTCG